MARLKKTFQIFISHKYLILAVISVAISLKLILIINQSSVTGNWASYGRENISLVAFGTKNIDFFYASKKIYNGKKNNSHKTAKSNGDKIRQPNEKYNLEKFQYRKKLIQKMCRKLLIATDNVTRPEWNDTNCHPGKTEPGYSECVYRRHFPLARSSSTMTCLINKVASTSMAKVFLENNGLTKCCDNNITSPHVLIDTITAESKAAFLFAKKHFFKFMVVREPFERLLSAYIDKIVIADHWSLWALRLEIAQFIFMHKGYLSNNEGENVLARIMENYYKSNYDFEKEFRNKNINDSYIPTFQEFLEYAMYAPQDGVDFASHWIPYWKWCAPCSMDYDAIIKFNSATTELEYVWARMSILGRTKIPWLNRLFRETDDLEAAKRLYYSALPFETIADVYQHFELDFLLFDYDIADVLVTAGHCVKGECWPILSKYFYKEKRKIM